MVFRRTMATAKCPACSSPVEISRSIFRDDVRCPHCGVALGVSTLYSRLLVVLSISLAVALVWGVAIHGVPSCLICIATGLLLGIPVAFLVLTLLVRIAPFLVKPTLVLRQRYQVTSLNLTPGPKDDPRR